MKGGGSVYNRLSNTELLAVLNAFENVIKYFLFTVRKYPADLKYNISRVNLIDMIIQVDKRCAHYKYFHDGMEINEAKKLGVYIYWFLKFKPINLFDDRYKTKLEPASENELFAVSLLRVVLKSLGRDTSLVKGGVPYYDELQYSFKFRTFTVGSMMVLADSFR